MIIRVVLQLQIILQYFYKLLLWPTSYWFSYRPTNNIIFYLPMITHHISSLQFFFNYKKVYISGIFLIIIVEDYLFD